MAADRATRDRIPRRRRPDYARRASGGRITQDISGPGPESPVRKARTDWYEPKGSTGARDAPVKYARGGRLRRAGGGGVDDDLADSPDDARKPAQGPFGPMLGTTGPINLREQKAGMRADRDAWNKLTPAQQQSGWNALRGPPASKVGQARGGRLKKRDQGGGVPPSKTTPDEFWRGYDPTRGAGALFGGRGATSISEELERTRQSRGEKDDSDRARGGRTIRRTRGGEVDAPDKPTPGPPINATIQRGWKNTTTGETKYDPVEMAPTRRIPNSQFDKGDDDEGWSGFKGFRGGGWIGPARERMEKKGTVGALHKQLGVAAGDKIPASKLSAAKSRAKRTGNTQLMRRVTFAQNVRK